VRMSWRDTTVPSPLSNCEPFSYDASSPVWLERMKNDRVSPSSRRIAGSQTTLDGRPSTVTRSLLALTLICFIVGGLSAAEPDIAAKLTAAKVERYAAAPSYSEGPTWRDGEVFFCSGGLLRVTKDRKVRKYLDINPAGTYLCGDGRILICDNK